MTGVWTVDRIFKLADIRRGLMDHGPDFAIRALHRWSNWTEESIPAKISDGLLFFILRFSSDEGDQVKLSKILHSPDDRPDQLENHPIVGPYLPKMSASSLGFPLLPRKGQADLFDQLLLKAAPMNLRYFAYLQELNPDLSPFVARLAHHVADVSQDRRIPILSDISTNLAAATEYLLPGIENPFLASFRREPLRWYFCPYGGLNYVDNCGQRTINSICSNCRVCILHNGSRQATEADFQPPRGIHLDRKPQTSPSYSVRDKSPLVTRLSLLLTCLAMMSSALDPRTDDRMVLQLLQSLPATERRQSDNRRSLMEMLDLHIATHMKIFFQLYLPLYVSVVPLTVSDQFKFVHLLVMVMLDCPVFDRCDARTPQVRDSVETFLEGLLAKGKNLSEILKKQDLNCKAFQQALVDNENSSSAYGRRAFADRRSVQLEMARDATAGQRLKYLHLILDDVWAAKLDALQYLGDAMRFAALVRTVLPGKIPKDEAFRMSVRDGLRMMIEMVGKKAVILDRGRPMSTAGQVEQLFDGLKHLGRFQPVAQRRAQDLPRLFRMPANRFEHTSEICAE